MLAIGYAMPLFYLTASLINGQKVGANPWGAKGLEWEAADSPPHHENFEATPIVTDTVADTVAPVAATAPQFTYVGDRIAFLAWSTDEPADALLRYRADGSTEIQGVGRSSLDTGHQLAFNELQPDTLYHVEIASRDVSGNTPTLGGLSFTTEASADTAVPQFSECQRLSKQR